MLLKSFFFTVYLLLCNFSFYISCLVFFISINFLFSDLRKKFLLFILVIILFSMVGFLFDLDGIFLIFLVAELTIFLLLLMTYTQLFPNYSFIEKKKYNFVYLVALMFFFNPTPMITFFPATCYYKSLYYITSSDFFILYHFLFEQIPVITVLIILIISFFSLFFIVLYFNLKLVKGFLVKKFKSTYLLRKQMLSKQTLFYNQVYTFQN